MGLALGDADVGVLVEALLGIDPDVGEPPLADLVLELFEVVSTVVVVEEGVGQRLVDGVTLVVVNNQTVLIAPMGEKTKKNRRSDQKTFPSKNISLLQVILFLSSFEGGTLMQLMASGLMDFHGLSGYMK